MGHTESYHDAAPAGPHCGHFRARHYRSRMNTTALPGLPDPAVVAKGYAHPERLVSTDWLAANLHLPSLRLLECNEDVLLYNVEHIPGAQKLDWHTDLNDAVERDYVSREQFEALLRSKGIDETTHGRLLRRQEQLVGDVCLLGVPAVRLRQRHGARRRPREVAVGGTRDDDGRPVVSSDQLHGEGTRRRERSARSSPTRARISTRASR